MKKFLLVLILSGIILSACSCNILCRHDWIDATCQVPQHCSKCNFSKGETIECSYTNGECAICGTFDETYCLPIYENLRTEMLTLNDKWESIEKIEEYLNSLPQKYKDVASIRTEFIFVKTQFQIFFDAEVDLAYNAILDITNNKEAERRTIDLASIQKAYFNLIEKHNQYTKWDLQKGAEEWIATSPENNLLLRACLMGIWSFEEKRYNSILDKTTTTSYYIQFTERGDHTLSFTTNIPNDMEEGTEYFYFVEGNTIGYKDKDGNKFNAYKILELSKEYAKVLCYKNSKIYTLHRE